LLVGGVVGYVIWRGGVGRSHPVEVSDDHRTISDGTRATAHRRSPQSPPSKATAQH
jgi:hypothetical protein